MYGEAIFKIFPQVARLDVEARKKFKVAAKLFVIRSEAEASQVSETFLLFFFFFFFFCGRCRVTTKCIRQRAF